MNVGVAVRTPSIRTNRRDVPVGVPEAVASSWTNQRGSPGLELCIAAGARVLAAPARSTWFPARVALLASMTLGLATATTWTWSKTLDEVIGDVNIFTV